MIYFNVREDGDVVQEPDLFGFPYIQGGHFAFDNPADVHDGAFTGSMIWRNSSNPDDTTSHTLFGTMSSNYMALNFTSPWLTSATRTSQFTDLHGDFSFERTRLYNAGASSHHIYQDSGIVSFSEDGSCFLQAQPSLIGNWYPFRGNVIEGDCPGPDADLDGHPDFANHFHINLGGGGKIDGLAASYSGIWSTLAPDNSVIISGNLTSYRIDIALNNFVMTDLVHAWGAFFEYASTTSFEQFPRLRINAGGVIPAQGSILGGSVTQLNVHTGYYELTINFSGGFTVRLKGWLSLGKEFASARIFTTILATDTEIGSARMSRADDAAWNAAWPTTGQWSIGLPSLEPGRFLAAIYNCAADTSGILDAGSNTIGFSGSIMIIGPGVYSVVFTVDAGPTSDSYWLAGDFLLPGEGGSALYCLHKLSLGGLQETTGMLFPYTQADVDIPISEYAGNYVVSETGQPPFTITMVYTPGAGEGTLSCSISTFTFALVWVDRSRFEFRLENMAAGMLYFGDIFRFTPEPMAQAIHLRIAYDGTYWAVKPIQF